MKHSVSIIIPHYNGSRTIGKCLESVFAFSDDAREVIVADDRSDDNSREIIKKFPCRLIELEKHAGASAARNAGARGSTGDILFFIDADCLLQRDALSIIRAHMATQPSDAVLGGTYTPVPADPGFFSLFQSAFINYSETKNRFNPDYIATHALVIGADAFRKAGGFSEDFMPILEDVEFCHRLRKAGSKLSMIPELQVRHIFNFSLGKSLRNAARKTRYWTVYSLANRDLFADSGTASQEIKMNGAAWLLTVCLAILFLLTGQGGFLAPVPLLWAGSMYINRNLFKAFFRAGGARFALPAGMYYTIVYPGAVWTGFLRGVIQYACRHAMQQGKVSHRRSSRQVP